MLKRILWFMLFLLGAGSAAGTASAQCFVTAGSNEGRLLAFYTVPIVFSAATAPGFVAPGTVRLGFEGEYLPSPSAEIQRTGACFTRKSENTSITKVFGRPRVTVALPGGLAFEASYLPPIKIADATPNLGALAISETRHFEILPTLGGLSAMLRGHTTFGSVKGPITCPAGSLQTSAPTAPCYGTVPSKDTFHPDMAGVELAASITPPGGPFSFYAGAGANRIDPHFQVGFRDAAGNVDTTRVQLRAASTRAALLAGVTAKWRSRLDLGLQVYSVPADATTLRLHGGLRLP